MKVPPGARPRDLILESLTRGDRQCAFALVDLDLLPVELLLQVPNLKLQSVKLQVAGGCHVDQLFVVQIYRSALAICERPRP